MFSQLTRRTLAGLLLSAVGFGTAHAGAFNNITVGQAGLAGNCTVATIQEAINLAAAHPGPDTIWVTRDTPDGYYLATASLTINDPNVEIVGGFDNCFDETPSGYTDISGNGNALDPVFRIRGTSSVRLQNLVITLGDADGTEGAGIDFQGSGVLEIVNSVLEYNNTQGGSFGGGIRVVGNVDLAIANSRINNNTAQSGGGISFQGTGRVILNNTAVYENAARASGGGLFLQGSGGTISAYLEQGVTISRNSAADDGGGVYAGTQVGLEWNGADAEMWLNTAGDLGGGIVATDGTTLDLFPRGRFHVPTGTYHSVIYANSARHGGGVAAAVLQNRDINVRLSSHDGLNPQIVAYNQASDRGGAFYLKASASEFNRAILCLNDTSAIGNIASRGAVIYSQRDDDGIGNYFGNEIRVNSQQCGLPARPRCAAGRECTEFSANQASLGAVIDDEGDGLSTFIRRAKIVGNTGSHVIYISPVEGPAFPDLNSNLIAQNTVSGSVVYVRNSLLEMLNNTIADNVIGGAVIDAGPTDESIAHPEYKRNIIVQPGSFTLNLNGGTPQPGTIVDNLSNDMTLASYDPSNFSLNPLFAPNYRLSPQSPAVDRAVREDSPNLDAAGNPRPFDRPDVLDYQPGTTTDLGAYELQAGLPDAMFRNGFE
jgi:predicted outer membrane repeat protein